MLTKRLITCAASDPHAAPNQGTTMSFVHNVIAVIAETLARITRLRKQLQLGEAQ